MTAAEIGSQLVALCNEGKGLEAVERFYDEKIVSIEGEASEALPQVMEGIEAIKGKNTWWYENHDIHASTAEGSFCGRPIPS